MTDSKEESRKASNSKRVSSSREVVLSSNQAASNKSSRTKEGILLVSLSLVIMVAAYFIYNGGFGMGSNILGNTSGDGVCQSTENCLDQPMDCACVDGEVCSASEKQCSLEELPPAAGDYMLAASADGELMDLPEEGEASLGIPAASIDLILENCIYNVSGATISCETNCLGGEGGNTILSVMDSDNNLAIARESLLPFKMGNISFSPGTVTFKADHVEIVGSVISSSLEELNNDSVNWMVAMSCNNPIGTSSMKSVLKQ
jgi:hypothetical protein